MILADSATEPSSPTPPFAAALGWAVYVMCRTGAYADFPIASVGAWLLPAARLRQLHIFTGPEGQVLGYITWALLSAEVEARWMNQTSGSWHLSEWNEGDRLWIVDFVIVPGYIWECLRQASSVLSSFSTARYLRTRPADKKRVLLSIQRLSGSRLRGRRLPLGDFFAATSVQ